MRVKSRVVTSVLGGLAFAAAMTAPVTAHASDLPRVDWGRMLADVDAVVNNGSAVLDSPRCALAGCQTEASTTARAPERTTLTEGAQLDRHEWFAVDPKFSLVARDWSSAFRVAGGGERLALVDALRLTSSTRMVMGRVRLNASRISPFVQVGVGQWRIDPYLLPLTQKFTEIAAQAAIGLEMRVVGTWQVGLETSTTMLYREYREQRDQAMPAMPIWNTTFASRVDF
ncbi:MAG: hypothetical protein JWP97_2666 [Labilithrix sp.]|nr:hypothetical protein [Labilithrix sp.]